MLCIKKGLFFVVRGREGERALAYKTGIKKILKKRQSKLIASGELDCW